MKKLGVLAIVVCAVAVAATATAGTSKYRGTIDPSGRLSFKLEKKRGKQRVINLVWASLPVTCKGGKAATTGGHLNYRVAVRNGVFHASAFLGNEKNPNAEADVRGKIKGRKASGRITVDGRKLPIAGSSKGAKCASGKLKWTAAR